MKPSALPSLPLTGRTVAVTQSGEDGQLLRLLHQLGAAVLHVPLVRFAGAGDVAALHAQLRDLGNVDWLVLSSRQGVSALLLHLERLELKVDHLNGVRVAAVGTSTARSLEQAGVPVDFVPARPGARFLGAELPARPGETVLHLTSQLAEDALAQALSRRGIEYRRAEAYRTEAVPVTPAVGAALRQADAVTLASGSAARQLVTVTGTDRPVIVMGAQTAAAAQAAGFSDVTVAEVATVEALAQAVLRRLGEQGGGQS